MKFILCVIVAAAMAIAAAAAQSKPAADLYQEALHLQEIQGDLTGAIAAYKNIVERHGSDRPVAAKALLQLGACYEKLGRSEARQAYERIVREYADIADAVTRARAQLTVLGSANGGPFKMVPLDSMIESISPDGRHAIYHKDMTDVPGRVTIRDMRTGAERLLLHLDGAVGSVAWSPDSRHLAFRFQNVQKNVREARILTIATGETRTLPSRDYPTHWSAAGDLYFYRIDYAANTMEITTMPAAGGEPRPFLTWSLASSPFVGMPDVKAFLTVKANRLLLVDVATRAERPITTGSAEERNPVVSHDGRLVAFVSNPDGKWALYVAPVDRIPVREPLRIAAIDPARLGGANIREPLWLADGTLSLVASDAASDIFRIAVDSATGRATSAPTRLTQDAPWNRAAVVSPDSEQIAYWFRHGAKAGLAVMDADGRNERRLLEQTGRLPLAWRAPGEILFYDFSAAQGQKPAITVYNVKTGATTPLTHLAGLYWKYVPARQEILHSHPGGGGPRSGLVLRARSIVDGGERDVAAIDNLHPWIAISRDGRRIAYTAASDASMSRAQCEVALMSIEGKKERVLVPMQRPCAVAADWSPDGRFLLLNTPEGPRVLDVERAQSWPLHAATTVDPSSPSNAHWEASSWSPDGAFVTLTFAQTRSERLSWAGVTYEAVTKLMKVQRPS